MSLATSKSWIFDLVTMIAVLAGVAYGALELRNLRELQEREAVIELFHSTETEQWTKGVQLILALPDTLSGSALQAEVTRENMYLVTYLIRIWEGVGVLVYRRDIPIEWVDEMFGGLILLSWEKIERYVRDLRRQTGRNSFAEWTQWLVERLREHRAGREPSPAYEAHRSWRP